MNLEINQATTDEKVIVMLSGEVDAYTAPKLREVLIPLTEQSGNQVVINLANVSYIDSTGLGIFIGALKSSHTHQSKISLQGLTSRVERLFRITGLDEVIDIEDKREEAK
ncbi:STAS domain-containing protein [Bacillus alkalicellulosilyticus]|uniref:STAS domain-containing protein n=1 Tax=Alkalihalobacterium alkalicellulosilyticum TaxID=1912214 RepID=UPI0009972777|nr:STAS domain-containing protein [Bacillus alkalicellulosilyticus]